MEETQKHVRICLSLRYSPRGELLFRLFYELCTTCSQKVIIKSYYAWAQPAPKFEWQDNRLNVKRHAASVLCQHKTINSAPLRTSAQTTCSETNKEERKKTGIRKQSFWFPKKVCRLSWEVYQAIYECASVFRVCLFPSPANRLWTLRPCRVGKTPQHGSAFKCASSTSLMVGANTFISLCLLAASRQVVHSLTRAAHPTLLKSFMNAVVFIIWTNYVL